MINVETMVESYSYLFVSVIAFSLQTAEALAEQVSQENFDKGLIYPPFSNIRKISAQIAARVAAKAYELGNIFIPIPKTYNILGSSSS